MEREAPDLIKDVKAMYGLTQKELEKVLKITQQAVSDYERGKVRKEQSNVIKKLEALHDWKIDSVTQRILEDKGTWHTIQLQVSKARSKK